MIEEKIDNSPLDKSPLEGVIMIEGLEHGQSYSITYKGNRKEEVITQDDLNNKRYERGYKIGRFREIRVIITCHRITHSINTQPTP